MPIYFGQYLPLQINKKDINITQAFIDVYFWTIYIYIYIYTHTYICNISHYIDVYVIIL